ncbi:MAG: beta-ketoacyl-[acyl-carrier-protein] synthase family protein, partial [Phycisphaerae bacterium]
APVTACASGGHALQWAVRLIERGAADLVLTGAAEASIHPLVLASYRRMGVLADARGDPPTSVRPFSLTRRGFAVGEGAAVLVVESEASARCRGAEVLARVVGSAGGAQATDLTDVEASGASLARLMQEAVRRAGLGASDVDFVHAHGTATPANDLAEAKAIRSAFGRHAGGLSVSSTKGSHGHLLGAAAAVEMVLTVLALRRQEVPATANLTDPDPAIGLDCTPLRARTRVLRYAMKISSGFGGQASAVCLGR